MNKVKMGVNDLASVDPELVTEWDYKKNGNLKPQDISYGNKKKVWWIGKCGHSWEASVLNRHKGAGCPVCRGIKALKGYNDLKSQFPDIVLDWDYKKNVDINPEDIPVGSTKKVWWICNRCGREWETSVVVRTKGSGCPTCSHSEGVKKSRLRKGENSLMVCCPDLCKEWDYEKNNISPSSVTPQSHDYAFWKCSKGHSYKARIQNRTLGSGCPVCNGTITIRYDEKLAITHQDILDQWDYERNIITPMEITAGSTKKVFWICENGHKYAQAVGEHVNGSRCPICSGKQVLKGYNDLQTLYPYIAKDWDYEKNECNPTEVSPHSNKKVWWKCSRGHSYCTSVGARTGKNSGCPICSKELKTSFPEQAIYYYVKKIYSDAINRDNHIGQELDIYIPSENVAIEYDGIRWHSSEQKYEKDNLKDFLCKEKGIRLYRFRDINLRDTCYAKCISFDEKKSKSLEDAIKQLFVILGKIVDIDINRDYTEILKNYIITEKENSLLSQYPQIAEEWNSQKNGNLGPDMVAWGSGKKVWWKCKKCNTEFQCKISTRTGGKKQGCPICAKKKISINNSTPVINLDTNEVFESLSAAADSCKGRSGDISACCRGRQKRAHGYHWAYVNEPKKGRIKYKGKIINLDNGMIFDSLKDAADWCSGKTLNISACCRGKQKTAYGYRWAFKI